MNEWIWTMNNIFILIDHIIWLQNIRLDSNFGQVHTKKYLLNYVFTWTNIWNVMFVNKINKMISSKGNYKNIWKFPPNTLHYFFFWIYFLVSLIELWKALNSPEIFFQLKFDQFPSFVLLFFLNFASKIKQIN